MLILDISEGQHLYLADDFSLAGSYQKNRWVVRELVSPEKEYHFPSERALTEFLIWVEAFSPRRLEDIFFSPV